MTKESKLELNIELELSKYNKTGLKELCEKLEISPHSRKDVMINRLKLQMEEGRLGSPFDEGEFDAELELKYAKKEKKKKEKAEKVEIDYNWQDTPYSGRQVYTSAGTGNILKQSHEDVEGSYFLVQLADGTQRPVNEKPTRFKAVADGYRDKYIKDDSIRTESGAPSVHSGSEVSFALLGATSEEVGAVYKENDLWDLYKKKCDAARNHGMRRMDLVNILSARLRREEKVTIFGVSNMTKAAEVGKKKAAKAAEIAKKAKEEAKAAKAKETADAKAAKAKLKEEAKAAREEKAADAKAAKETKKGAKAAKPKKKVTKAAKPKKKVTKAAKPTKKKAKAA